MAAKFYDMSLNACKSVANLNEAQKKCAALEKEFMDIENMEKGNGIIRDHENQYIFKAFMNCVEVNKESHMKLDEKLAAFLSQQNIYNQMLEDYLKNRLKFSDPHADTIRMIQKQVSNGVMTPEDAQPTIDQLKATSQGILRKQIQTEERRLMSQVCLMEEHCLTIMNEIDKIIAHYDLLKQALEAKRNVIEERYINAQKQADKEYYGAIAHFVIGGIGVVVGIALCFTNPAYAAFIAGGVIVAGRGAGQM